MTQLCVLKADAIVHCLQAHVHMNSPIVYFPHTLKLLNPCASHPAEIPVFYTKLPLAILCCYKRA